MKVYKCKFIYENTMVKVGDKFIIFSNMLIPYKSCNGLGIDIRRVKPFDKFFEVCGEIKAKNVPFIKTQLKLLKGELKEAEKEVMLLKKGIAKYTNIEIE